VANPADRHSNAPTKISAKNTIDLQWKIRANYNARPCDGERKAAGSGTMASNGKNNAKNNGNSRKIRARAYVRLRAIDLLRRRRMWSMAVQLKTPADEGGRQLAQIRD